MSRRPVATPLLALVAVLALTAGCAPAEDAAHGPAASSDAGTPRPATPTPSPTPTPDPLPTEVGEARDATPEGTFLEPDEVAVLHQQWGLDPDADAAYRAAYTSRLTGVERGDAADLDGLDLDGDFDPATEDVHYVRATHTLLWALGNAPLDVVYPPTLHGWDADGSSLPNLLVFGVLDACTSGSLDEPQAGDEVETCDIVITPKGGTVAYAGVEGNPQISRDAHAGVTTEPVVWRTGS